MALTADADLQAVAEFMQANIAGEKLVPIARAMAGIAPALWGHVPEAEVRALSFHPVKPTLAASTG